MSVDFAALAQRVVASAPDVRTCLVMSRDGLPLGSHPAAEEERTRTVWTRLASLGEVERGFAVFRDEIWVFSRRGPYAAVATAGPTARPGLILEGLDEMLLAAVEARARRSSAVRPEPERDRDRDRERELETPRGPRTPLHRDPKPTAPPPAQPARTGQGPSRPAPVSEPPPATPHTSPDEAGSDDVWVDHVALAREFRGLFDQSAEEGY